jgi:hypothetical protein
MEPTPSIPLIDDGDDNSFITMYGDWIPGQYTVNVDRFLPDGTIVYLTYDGNTKMVTGKGEAKYYTGPISAFDPKLWSSYFDANGHYHVSYFFVMYGDWVAHGKEIGVAALRRLSDGKTRVYMIEDDGLTKMVTETGETRYYKGHIVDYDPHKWGVYTSATDHYHFKRVTFVPSSLIMYGDWVAHGNDVPVKYGKVLPDGRTWAFMIEDDGKTKMVTDSGEARYYEGQITQFDAQKWSTYTVATGHYHLKSSELMFGDGVNNGIPVPVKTERILADGHTRVYLAEDDGFTKMVTNKNEAKYYKGTISEFDPKNWGSYTVATGHYHVKHVDFVPNSLIMYGDWVANGNDVPVTIAQILPNGLTWVFIIFDDNKTKMVTDSGEARYYEGPISQFDAQKWSIYTDATGHYHLKSSEVMFGDWVNNGIPVPVKSERIIGDGRTRVYLTEDDGFTKMVADNNEAKYYKGKIIDFDSNNWASYTVATGHYHVKSVSFVPETLIMYGDWVANGKEVPVVTAKVMSDGRTWIYFIFDDNKTKMVTDSGEARYYEGRISQFDPLKWSTYAEATGHYHLKSSAFMFGDWVNTPVKTERILDDGYTRVYLGFDGFTKMVTDKDEAKYYEGPISDFDPKNWGKYIVATGHYHVNFGFKPSSLVMFGDWIGRDVPVASAIDPGDNTLVFLIENDGFTKMVNEKGVAKYFKGVISQFHAFNWGTYTDATGHYHVKSTLVMYGDWVNNGTPVPVVTERILVDGKTRVYLIEDDSKTKMVTEKGEAKYYQGHIVEFNNLNWATYQDAAGHYHVRNA